MDLINTDYNSLSAEDKKVFIKQMMDEKRNQFRNYNRERFEKVGLDITKYSDAQIALILEPSDAPENYFHDGEVTPEQAFKIWQKDLAKAGLGKTEIIKAITLNFNRK